MPNQPDPSREELEKRAKEGDPAAVARLLSEELGVFGGDYHCTDPVILAHNKRMREEGERVRKNQRPMTIEEIREQFRRHSGMTKDQYAEHLANWDKISKMPPVRRKRRSRLPS